MCAQCELVMNELESSKNIPDDPTAASKHCENAKTSERQMHVKCNISLEKKAATRLEVQTQQAELPIGLSN